MNHLIIKIGGPAGSGVFSVGAMVGKVLKRSGLWVYSCSDYPSLIKGGHNQYIIHACDKKIYSGRKSVDILVCLDKKTAELHVNELSKDGVLLYDSDLVKDLAVGRKDITVLPAAFNSLAVESGSKLYAGTIAFGVICGLVGIDSKIALDMIDTQFGSKGQEIIKQNHDAFDKGINLSKNKNNLKIKKLTDKNRIMVDGNLGISLGAIKAGCKFISAYPMTPATTIMQNLAANELEYNIITKQTEDEIAAINMAIGAAFTGARAMTATSGGGFSLMVEALGMAGIAEVPLVIAEVQRGGPSTGLPTYTAQDDLRFVQYASQGEFPRIIIAPGDQEECFYEGFNAFNLADKYQTPVILISDKELAAGEMTLERFDLAKLKINRGRLLDDNKIGSDFKRYELANDGISPRVVPGQPNGFHIASSYEHDETGYTSEEPDMHVLQMDKRAKKLDNLYDSVDGINVYGDKNADIQLVLWGSTKGPGMDSLELLKELKIKAKIIQVKYIWPFPIKQFEAAYDKKIPSLILEQNKSGQLRNIIRESTGIFIENFHGKYDSRPYYPEDIVEQVKKVLRK